MSSEQREKRWTGLFLKLQFQEMGEEEGVMSTHDWAEMEEIIMEDLNYQPEVPDAIHGS